MRKHAKYLVLPALCGLMLASPYAGQAGEELMSLLLPGEMTMAELSPEQRHEVDQFLLPADRDPLRPLDDSMAQLVDGLVEQEPTLQLPGATGGLAQLPAGYAGLRYGTQATSTQRPSLCGDTLIVRTALGHYVKMIATEIYYHNTGNHRVLLRDLELYNGHGQRGGRLSYLWLDQGQACDLDTLRLTTDASRRDLRYQHRGGNRWLVPDNGAGLHRIANPHNPGGNIGASTTGHPAGSGGGASSGKPVSPPAFGGSAEISTYGVTGPSTGNVLLPSLKIRSTKVHAYYDANGNGIIDPEQGDARQVFPRVNVGQNGWLQVGAGKAYAPGANLVVVAYFSTWSTMHRPQFVALHLKVSSGKIRPVALYAGDMETGKSPRVAMYSGLGFTLQSASLKLPPGTSGTIQGEVTSAMVYMTTPGGQKFASTVSLKFNTVLHRD